MLIMLSQDTGVSREYSICSEHVWFPSYNTRIWNFCEFVIGSIEKVFVYGNSIAMLESWKNDMIRIRKNFWKAKKFCNFYAGEYTDGNIL